MTRMGTRGTTAPSVGRARRIVVVGAGIAGLQTALVLRQLDARCAVVLVSKVALTESNTRYAQGGIAAVVPRVAETDGRHSRRAGGDTGDSVAAHIADTLAAGAGVSDPFAVSVLCHGAADGIRALRRAGVVFDTVGDTGTSLALGREAAHSAARILHLGGDATGAGLVDALTAAVRRDDGIEVLENTFVSRVLLSTPTGSVPLAVGVRVLAAGRLRDITADAVVLATGGAGQLFASTTNPVIATGDGVALAWRAGAVVADLEFFQFHPTSLDVPGNPLISEAVRGEGARLVDADGRAFMADYHPDGDLAPRDVVSRSIARHLALRASDPATYSANSSVAGAPDHSSRNRVYLDATALGEEFLTERFPSLSELTARYGFDWSSEIIPVVPAAHYWMGGVRTDADGRTSVPGLFAVGEVARTGVHGANRLASNSLLEGVVFGARCAAAIVHGRAGAPSFDAEPVDLDSPRAASYAFSRRDLQDLMSDHAGVLRTGAGLDLARKHLASYRAGADPETDNLLLCARLLVHAAMQRTASCGAHYRADQTETSPRPAPGRSYVRAAEGATE
ncbi:MAG: nadB [Micrococcaceae bacterium]|jgi:L-aspartate oxidase|nr:nadB [Micrococcaceae bacterium]